MTKPMDGVQSNKVVYLFFGDPHLVFDSREDGGLDTEVLLLHGRPPTLQCRPLLLPTLYQLHDLIKLLLINL